MSDTVVARGAPLEDILAGASKTLTAVNPGYKWSAKAQPLDGRRARLRAILFVYMAVQVASTLLLVIDLIVMASAKYPGLREAPGVSLLGQFIVTAVPAMQFVGPASVLIFVLCVICYFMFIHRAAKNLELSNARGLDLSPGGMIGWSFVPIASLWVVPNAMRQIWRASNNPSTGVGSPPGVFILWWVTYLAGNMVASSSKLLSRNLDNTPPAELFDNFLPMASVAMLSGLLLVLSTFCLLDIMGRITRLQAALATADTF